MSARPSRTTVVTISATHRFARGDHLTISGIGPARIWRVTDTTLTYVTRRNWRWWWLCLEDAWNRIRARSR